MKFPTEWKNKIHVPNQQPAFNDTFCQMIYIYECSRLKLCFLQGFGMMKTKLGKTSTFLGFGGYRDRMPKRILGVIVIFEWCGMHSYHDS
jgi:hypothetical protein